MYSLCLFFPQHNYFEIYSMILCVSIIHYFIAEKISLYGYSANLFIYYLLLIFRLLPVWAGNSQIAMGICVQFFVQKYISISLG